MKKKYYNSVWFWAIMVIGVLFVIVAFFEGINAIKLYGDYSLITKAVLGLLIIVFLFVRQDKDLKRDREAAEQQIHFNNLVKQIRLLENDATQEENNSEKAETIDSFILSWDTMMSDLYHLKEYDQAMVYDGNGVDAIIDEKKCDFQWKLRNAIERDKLKRIIRIRNDYKNSMEHRAREYQMFCVSLKENSNRFSKETIEFADSAATEIYNASRLKTPKVVLFNNASANNPEISGMSHVADAIEADKTLDEIVGMEGHQFEYWCADLLRENGFYNVSVTQGSGDQGVDVLAEKDGIRYAIQCKSYSSPLGNRPIQEVHTGKEFYNCHVGVVMTNSQFTAGAIEAAKRANTLLWDRTDIEKMINATRKVKNICPNCGNKLSGTEKYCTSCGEKLSN